VASGSECIDDAIHGHLALTLTNPAPLDSDSFGGLDLTDPELRNALEDTPNKFTRWVICIYVMKRCITDGLSLQTAHAIHTV
jgi:hypothetical protein